MASKPLRVYWDSCVWLDLVQETPGRFQLLKEIYDDAKHGRIKLVISTLVIAEVTRCGTFPVPQADIDKIREHFENDFISVRGVDRPTAEEAAKIGQSRPISGADAVHIATAIRAQCCVLHTYDGVTEPNNLKKMLAQDGLFGRPLLPIKQPYKLATVSHSAQLDFLTELDGKDTVGQSASVDESATSTETASSDELQT